MRKLHALMGFLFLVAALLQYNDPDPWRWAVTYTVAAWVALSEARGVHRPLLISGLVGACLVWMSFLYPAAQRFMHRGDWSLLAATMKAGQPLIEESREFLGLALVLLWCVAVLAARAWRRR